MIIASLAGVNLTEETISLDKIKEKGILEKCPMATLPCLETDEGQVLSSSMAIVMYLASFKPELLGASDFEKAQVDQWM